MKNIDNLASMFSQINGVQQSMSSSIMSAIMGYIMQKGMGSMLLAEAVLAEEQKE